MADRASRGLFLVILWSSLVASSGPSVSAADRPPDRRYSFERDVANVEYAAVELSSTPPPTVGRAPEVAGRAWYGRIMRRLPGDGPGTGRHYVGFLAEYRDGVARRAWCDVNFNGDLRDDPPLPLSIYPAIDGSRSFLVDLRWATRLDARDRAVDWKVRVVLERQDPEGRVLYHVQMVHAMVGKLVLEGKPHRAFLFDGDGDGFYTRHGEDGVFVDLDDDLRFDVDPMDPEFGPFAFPFQMGRRLYEVTEVEAEGRYLTLVEKAVVEPRDPPAIGQPSPPFSFRDLQGREIRLTDYRDRPVLVYFWASWCGKCSGQAATVQRLYSRYRAKGLEILGVSYDTDRAALEAFRRKHDLRWPTSFSGRAFSEEPIGRLYQARAPCMFFLVDREGRLEGVYDDVAVLESRLGTLLSAG